MGRSLTRLRPPMKRTAGHGSAYHIAEERSAGLTGWRVRSLLSCAGGSRQPPHRELKASCLLCYDVCVPYRKTPRVVCGCQCRVRRAPEQEHMHAALVNGRDRAAQLNYWMDPKPKEVHESGPVPGRRSRSVSRQGDRTLRRPGHHARRSFETWSCPWPAG
jgi:hypothetical protein